MLRSPSLKNKSRDPSPPVDQEPSRLEGEEGLWVEDAEGNEGFCPCEDQEAFWQLEGHDALIFAENTRSAFLSLPRCEKVERQKERYSAEGAAFNLLENIIRRQGQNSRRDHRRSILSG